MCKMCSGWKCIQCEENCEGNWFTCKECEGDICYGCNPQKIKPISCFNCRYKNIFILESKLKKYIMRYHFVSPSETLLYIATLWKGTPKKCQFCLIKYIDQLLSLLKDQWSIILNVDRNYHDEDEKEDCGDIEDDDDQAPTLGANIDIETDAGQNNLFMCDDPDHKPYNDEFGALYCGYIECHEKFKYLKANDVLFEAWEQYSNDLDSDYDVKEYIVSLVEFITYTLDKLCDNDDFTCFISSAKTNMKNENILLPPLIDIIFDYHENNH